MPSQVFYSGIFCGQKRVYTEKFSHENFSVQMRGLEPPTLAGYGPKPYAYTNSATPAKTLFLSASQLYNNSILSISPLLCTMQFTSIWVMKAIAKLTLAVIFFLFLATPAHADFTQAYNDYQYQYKLYNDYYSEFTVAKVTYQTYGTFASQAELLKKFQQVLTQRNRVVSSYLDLLQEKLFITQEIENRDIDAYSQIRKDTKTWLENNQIRVNNATALGDLNRISDEFRSFYPQTQRRIRQVIAKIVLTHGLVLHKKMDQLFSTTEDLIRTIGQSGENITDIQRAFIQIKTKKDLYEEKYAQAKETLFPNDSYTSADINVYAGQLRLIEAGQYAIETVNQLLEVIKYITG